MNGDLFPDRPGIETSVYMMLSALRCFGISLLAESKTTSCWTGISQRRMLQMGFIRNIVFTRHPLHLFGRTSNVHGVVHYTAAYTYIYTYVSLRQTKPGIYTLHSSAFRGLALPARQFVYYVKASESKS